MRLSEIKGNIKTWKEQRDSLFKKIEKLDRRTEEIEKKISQYEKESQKND